MSLYNVPTPASTCAQRQIQVSSVVAVLFGITPILMIAKTIVMTVRHSMPRRASFFLNDIWTFQSPMTGILSTTELQSVLLRPVLNPVALTHDLCDDVGCTADLQVDPCVLDLLLLRTVGYRLSANV